MSKRNLKERLVETISSNDENTIVIIWCSESAANKNQEALTTDYLDFVRKCSNERKIKNYGESSNFVFLAKPPIMAISIAATIEALKNSDSFLDEIFQFCERHQLSYIQTIEKTLP